MQRHRIMRLQDVCKSPLVWIVVLVHSGCSRSPEGVPPRDNHVVKSAVRSNITVTAATPLVPRVQTNINQLWLEELTGGDPMSRFLAADLLKKSPKARVAL